MKLFLNQADMQESWRGYPPKVNFASTILAKYLAKLQMHMRLNSSMANAKTDMSGQ